MWEKTVVDYAHVSTFIEYIQFRQNLYLILARHNQQCATQGVPLKNK